MKKNEFYRFTDREALLETVRETGTPCYLYFSRIIRHQVKALASCLGDGFSVHYAVKANPCRDVLDLMVELGTGADVASGGELAAALACGFAPENIEFSGPGKTADELAAAVQAGIGSLNAESPEELELLASVAEHLGKPVNTGIRVNPDVVSNRSGISMSGDTQFGIPESHAAEALAFIRERSDLLHFTGIHVHVGSQILVSDAILENMAHIMDLALDLEDASGMAMKKINFGGGWGVPCFPGQYPMDLEVMAEEIAELFDESEYRDLRDRARLIVEPGRFLTAESGVFCTKVLYRKQMNTKSFAIVNGGMHQNYPLAGGMGQVMRRNFEMDILPSPDLPPPESCFFRLDVAGPLCTPQDILASGHECSLEVRPGDYIVFFNCGAYGLSASPVRFLGHPEPIEILV